MMLLFNFSIGWFLGSSRSFSGTYFLDSATQDAIVANEGLDWDFQGKHMVILVVTVMMGGVVDPSYITCWRLVISLIHPQPEPSHDGLRFYYASAMIVEVGTITSPWISHRVSYFLPHFSASNRFKNPSSIPNRLVLDSPGSWWCSSPPTLDLKITPRGGFNPGCATRPWKKPIWQNMRTVKLDRIKL